MYNEFTEIHDAWAELMTIYNEIDGLNQDVPEIRGYGRQAAPAAAAN